jgi:hypothetical protein
VCSESVDAGTLAGDARLKRGRDRPIHRDGDSGSCALTDSDVIDARELLLS